MQFFLDDDTILSKECKLSFAIPFHRKSSSIVFVSLTKTRRQLSWREIKGGRKIREGEGRRGEVLTEQPYFGKKGGTLNFIDVAHGAMQARTIEPGSVCDGRLAKGRPYVLRRDNYNKQPSLALPHHWSKKSAGVIYQKFHGGWNGCNVTEQRVKFFILFLLFLSHVRILFRRLIF